MRDDEHRLDQLGLGGVLEQLQLQQADAVGSMHLFLERRERVAQVSGIDERIQRIARIVLVDRLGHRQALELRPEVD